MSEEIDAAKVEAICTVLKAALPELVTIAYGAFKADKFAVSTIAAGLSDAEWKKVKRDENQRREGETMRKICRCDLCGDWTWSVRVRAEHDVPLAVMVRSFRHGLENEGPCSFELTDQNGVLIPDVPTLCQRCFEEEFDSNRSATFDEFVDSLRRRKVH